MSYYTNRRYNPPREWYENSTMIGPNTGKKIEKPAEPDMTQYIQDRINMYAGTPFPNKSSECMKAYWLDQMDLYKGYLRGEVKRSQLDMDMLNKMSGWTMPEWGYARS